MQFKFSIKLCKQTSMLKCRKYYLKRLYARHLEHFQIAIARLRWPAVTFWPVNDCYCNLWMCFIKNNCRIDFLVPENIKNAILFMFLSHLVAKIWAELDFQNSMAAILDFVNFKHVPGNRKNDNIIFLNSAYILILNQVKNQF